jgi:hypothetical protein
MQSLMQFGSQEDLGNDGPVVILTLLMRGRVRLNCRRISQTFSPGGVPSPFVAQAMPTRPSDKRLRKYANLAAAADLLEFELCSYVAFGLLISDL